MLHFEASVIMSYRSLYESVQSIDGRISTAWLKAEAMRLSGFTLIKEQWTDVMNPQYMAGFFIEGPLGPPVPLDNGQALIVLPREYEKDRRRLVYTKELMHVFDTPDEKADSPEKFDAQAERFADPSAQISPQFMAEGKALWRALGVLCQESKRLDFSTKLKTNQTSPSFIAANLEIPQSFVRLLVRDDFLAVINTIKD